MKKANIDVLGLGVVAVDDLIYAESYPPPDSKTRVHRTERQCGGLTAIALIAASRLGANCAYAGVLGKDELSAFAIQQLQTEGIHLNYLRQRAKARTVHSYIVVDSKHHTRNIFFKIDNVIGADSNWPPADVIQRAKVLFVDHFGLPGMIRAARLARAAGIPVVADFERVSGPRFPKLLSLVDHLILSQTFAQELTGEKSPASAAKRLWTNKRELVAITCGSEGCWYLSSDNPDSVQHQPAFKVDVVDTTGCGDVFHGAYAAALARGLKLNDRIQFASAAAALKATRAGAQKGIPSLSEVEKFLRKN